jgi:phage terminase large subunit
MTATAPERVEHRYRPVGSAAELFRSRAPEILLSGAAGTGKAQPLDAVVQTPSGPRRMGDITVGDLVLGADGTPVKVMDIPFWGTAPVWRLTLTGGVAVECSDGHLWQTNAGVKSVADMLSAGLRDRRGRRRYWIPQPGPAEYVERPVPVPPYTLGVLLGDGHLRPGEVSFTTADQQIEDRVASEVAPRYKLVTSEKRGNAAWNARIVSSDGRKPRRPSRAKLGYVSRTMSGKWMARVREEGKRADQAIYIGSFNSPGQAQAVIDARPLIADAGDSIHGDLDALGLRNARSHTKSVPEVYKVNSVRIRLAVLQGLMDTDGYAGKTEVSFCSVSQRLAEDVRWLAESLGGVATITTKQPKGGQLAYQVWLRMPDPAEVFFLDRKRERAGVRKSPVRRYIESAEPVGERQCQCITVSANDGLYLTEQFVVTHNSRACLEKMHAMCCLPANAGMRALIVRKTAVSLGSTALVTFREAVAREALASGEVKFYGGSSQEAASYQYGNGSVIVLGGMDKVSRIMSSEYDCLTGDALVVSPSEVQKAYGRPYSGKLVTITTAGGNKLTGTPNHPVLTSHGWRGLGQLREGDHVVSRCLVQDERPGADPHVADQPAPIAEVARALALANPGCSERGVTVPVDFHGDGAYGYVDVVTTARLFHRRGPAASLNPVPQLNRRRGDLEQAALVAHGAGSQGVLGRGRSRLASLGSSELAHPLTVGRGAAPGIRGPLAAFGELALPFGVGSHPDLPGGERVGGSLPADAPFGHLGLEPGNADVDGSRDGEQPPFAGEVTPDRIVNVSVADAGAGRHVYNLQTASNWYFANNIVSHNCIYVQEATELTEDDWEALTTRLRYGRVSFQQIMADCNPSAPHHWLKQRADRGATQLIYCRHEDNPRLFDDDEWSPEGTEYLRRLDALTGVRYERLRLGHWAAAEGLIYDMFDPAVHLYKAMGHPPDSWTRWWGVDFGFTNPFCWQAWAQDPDGRLYLYKEIYRTQTLVEDHARAIIAATRTAHGREPPPREVVCDHDAEGRATLESKLGLSTTAAHKSVLEGIEAVKARLKVQPDGKPRLYICRDALIERDQALVQASKPECTQSEILEYIWDDKAKKEQPRKEADHGLDALRYVVAAVDLVGRPRLRFLQ